MPRTVQRNHRNAQGTFRFLSCFIASHRITKKSLLFWHRWYFVTDRIVWHLLIDSSTACARIFVPLLQVCGVVVNWPLQSETGRMGAACGRVIFALEQLWERSNESIAASASSADDASLDANNNNRNLQERGGLLSRPFCLWDAGHIDLKQRADPSKRVDVFGRCASYGKEQPRSSSEWSQRTRAADGSSSSSSTSSTSASTAHTSRYGNDGSKACDYFASKEQYHEDELTVVLGVWDDFCREHWPDLYITAAAATSSNSPNLHSNNDEEGKNIKDDGTHDSSSLYSDLGGPSKAKPPPPKLREVTKKKKCLVTMR